MKRTHECLQLSVTAVIREICIGWHSSGEENQLPGTKMSFVKPEID